MAKRKSVKRNTINSCKARTHRIRIKKELEMEKRQIRDKKLLKRCLAAKIQSRNLKTQVMVKKPKVEKVEKMAKMVRMEKSILAWKNTKKC